MTAASHRSPCITLTTDFGNHDGYVGAMKGAILRINPRVTLVDITHHIPPHDVRAAAFVLFTAYAFFPPKTLHVVVVDPTVGTSRRLVAAQMGSWTFVAPDTGVLGLIAQRESLRRAVQITARPYLHDTIAATFHGRDILAPAAAHLSLGVPLQRLGPPVRFLRQWPWPVPQPRPQGGQRGEVIYSDRFGNLITNLALTERQRRHAWMLRYRRRTYPLKSTYATVPRDAILAVVGSNGLVELAVREGSARERFQARLGEPVALIPTACRND